jgi:hypothetical protein
MFVEIASKKEGQWLSVWLGIFCWTPWIFPNEPAQVFMYILKNMIMNFAFSMEIELMLRYSI